MTNHAAEYADSLSESISENMGAVFAGGYIEGQDAGEYVTEWPLEIVRTVGQRFQIVLTVGGPDARVECDLDSTGARWGAAELVVRWGTDTERRYGRSIDQMADYFAEMFEGVDDTRE